MAAKECKCKDWKANIEILNSAVSFYFTHFEFKGLKKSFIYCPYCRKKLVEIKTKK